MNEFDFHIGAEIYGTDARWGHLAKVALEPETWRVTHLIAQSGILLKEGHVIPIEVVTSATDKAIQLSITTDELQTYEPYKEKHYEVPIESGQYGRYAHSDVILNSQGSVVASPVPMQQVTIHEGIPQTLALLKKGTPVRNENGEVGKLDDIVIDADSSEITHLMIHHGLLFPNYLVVPVEVIKEIGEEGIFIEATIEELKGDMPYLPEDDGVPDDESQLLPVSTGEIGNGLTADGIMANRVTKALRIHPVTADAVIEVVNQGGLVTLIGTVRDEKTRQTAEKVAANQDSVVKVVNELVVRTVEYS